MVGCAFESGYVADCEPAVVGEWAAARCPPWAKWRRTKVRFSSPTITSSLNSTEDAATFAARLLQVMLRLHLVLAGTTAIGAVQCMITYRVGWQKHCQELGYVDDRHGSSVSYVVGCTTTDYTTNSGQWPSPAWNSKQ